MEEGSVAGKQGVWEGGRECSGEAGSVAWSEFSRQAGSVGGRQGVLQACKECSREAGSVPGRQGV